MSSNCFKVNVHGGNMFAACIIIAAIGFSVAVFFDPTPNVGVQAVS